MYKLLDHFMHLLQKNLMMKILKLNAHRQQKLKINNKFFGKYTQKSQFAHSLVEGFFYYSILEYFSQ